MGNMKINKCFFGIHKWSKWRLAKATFYSYVSESSHEVVAQTRECEICGRTEAEKV